MALTAEESKIYNALKPAQKQAFDALWKTATPKKKAEVMGRLKNEFTVAKISRAGVGPVADPEPPGFLDRMGNFIKRLPGSVADFGKKQLGDAGGALQDLAKVTPFVGDTVSYFGDFLEEFQSPAAQTDKPTSVTIAGKKPDPKALTKFRETQGEAKAGRERFADTAQQTFGLKRGNAPLPKDPPHIAALRAKVGKTPADKQRLEDYDKSLLAAGDVGDLTGTAAQIAIPSKSGSVGGAALSGLKQGAVVTLARNIKDPADTPEKKMEDASYLAMSGAAPALFVGVGQILKGIKDFGLGKLAQGKAEALRGRVNQLVDNLSDPNVPQALKDESHRKLVEMGDAVFTLGKSSQPLVSVAKYNKAMDAYAQAGKGQKELIGKVVGGLDLAKKAKEAPTANWVAKQADYNAKLGETADLNRAALDDQALQADVLAYREKNAKALDSRLKKDIGKKVKDSNESEVIRLQKAKEVADGELALAARRQADIEALAKLDEQIASLQDDLANRPWRTGEAPPGGFAKSEMEMKSLQSQRDQLSRRLNAAPAATGAAAYAVGENIEDENPDLGTALKWLGGAAMVGSGVAAGKAMLTPLVKKSLEKKSGPLVVPQFVAKSADDVLDRVVSEAPKGLEDTLRDGFVKSVLSELQTQADELGIPFQVNLNLAPGAKANLARLVPQGLKITPQMVDRAVGNAFAALPDQPPVKVTALAPRVRKGLEKIPDTMRGRLSAPFSKILMDTAEGKALLRALDGIKVLSIKRSDEQLNKSGLLDALARLKKASPEEYQNFMEIAQDLMPPKSQEATDALNLWRTLEDENAYRLAKFGAKVEGDKFARLDNYFPHVLTREAKEQLQRREGPIFQAMQKWASQKGEGWENVWDEYLALSQRSGGVGGSSLKHRTVDFPDEIDGFQILERDPLKVFKNNIEGVNNKLAILEQYGAEPLGKGSQLSALASRAKSRHGDIEKEIDGLIRQEVLGERAFNPVLGNAGQSMREIQTALKLPLATISNSFQTLQTTLPQFGMKATAKALRESLQDLSSNAPKGPAMQEVIDSGVMAEADMLAKLGVELTDSPTGRAAAKVLSATGFSAVERANRLVAALAGHSYYSDMARLLADMQPAAGYLKRVVKTGKLNPKLNDPKTVARMAFEKANLSPAEIAQIQKTGQIPAETMDYLLHDSVRKTQFTSLTGFDSPYWFNNDVAGLLLQFKRFGALYGNFVGEVVKDVAKTGDVPKLGLLLGGAAGAGEGLNAIRSWLGNREDITNDDWDRLKKDLWYAGILGFWGDVLTSRKTGGGEISLSATGPSGSDASNALQFFASRLQRIPKGVPVVGTLASTVKGAGRYEGMETPQAVSELVQSVSPVARYGARQFEKMTQPELVDYKTARAFANADRIAYGKEGKKALDNARDLLYTNAATGDIDKMLEQLERIKSMSPDDGEDLYHNLRYALDGGDPFVVGSADKETQGQLALDKMRGNSRETYLAAHQAYGRTVGRAAKALLENEQITMEQALKLVTRLEKQALTRPRDLEIDAAKAGASSEEIKAQAKALEALLQARSEAAQKEFFD